MIATTWRGRGALNSCAQTAPTGSPATNRMMLVTTTATTIDSSGAAIAIRMRRASKRVLSGSPPRGSRPRPGRPSCLRPGRRLGRRRLGTRHGGAELLACHQVGVELAGEAPAEDDADGVGQADELLEVGRDEQDTEAVATGRLDVVPDRGLRADVDAARRVRGNEDARVAA